MATHKVAAKTKLQWGVIDAEVGLFKTTGKPDKIRTFDTGGPNGGVLEQQTSTVGAAPATANVSVAPGDGPLPGEGVPSGVPGTYSNVLVERGTGIEVPREDVRLGIRREDGAFIDLTQQLGEIDERTKLDTMEVVGTIALGQVQRERVQDSYYLGCLDEDPEGPKRLRLLYEALKAEQRAAVVKWTKTSRQTCGVIVPHAATKTLMVLQLAWAEDWRDAPPRAAMLQQAQVYEGEVGMARELVKAQSIRRAESLDAMRDDALELREQLAAKALAGKLGTWVMPPMPESQDGNLEELLLKSLELAPQTRGVADEAAAEAAA